MDKFIQILNTILILVFFYFSFIHGWEDPGAEELFSNIRPFFLLYLGGVSAYRVYTQRQQAEEDTSETET